jgi:hypothetical protein
MTRILTEILILPHMTGTATIDILEGTVPIGGISVADPGCLSRILIFTHPGS